MLEKKGQLAVFVILAVVILVVILVFLLFPKILPTGAGVFSPIPYLQACVEPHLQSALDVLTKRGGYSNPEGFLEYKGEKIKYLCYTSEYYKTCTVQEPFIKERVEQELSLIMRDKVEVCVEQLKEEYEKRGYSVVAGKGAVQALFAPQKIVLLAKTPMTITKESTETFQDFSLEFKSELYDLLLTATSIISFETTYGDSETTLYMQYYPDLKIEKIKLSDGSKVYTLTNVITKDSFRFASRSLSWPPGYASQ